MAFIIGLTGSIGAGKSTAAAHFLNQGIPVVDADGISRTLTGPGAQGSLAVAQCFGNDFLTPECAMNRPRMRELVFKDPTALKRLEACLHPLIGQEVNAAFVRHRTAPLVIYDCPLLWRPDFRHSAVNRILVIDASDETRFSRILTRPGMTPDIVRRMMAAQASRRTILSVADDVIVNEDDETALRQKLTDLYNFWKTLPSSCAHASASAMVC